MTKAFITLVNAEGEELILRLPPGTQIPVGRVTYLGESNGLPTVEMELSDAWIAATRKRMQERGEL